MKKKRIYSILTCRTRGSFGNFICTRVCKQEYAHLWLSHVNEEIEHSLKLKDIHGYAIEISTLKYDRDSGNYNMKEFKEQIGKLNLKIPANIPVLWITHYNPKLSPEHKKYLLDRNVKISRDGKIQSRSNIITWLGDALRECPRSEVFDPTQIIQTDSSEIYVMKDNGLDTNHLPGGGVPVAREIQHSITEAAKQHLRF